MSINYKKLKKIFFITSIIAFFIIIILGALFWHTASVLKLDNEIIHKIEEVRNLIFCKQKSEEAFNKNSTYNYQFYLEKGDCPSKEELEKFKETISKLCQEINQDIEKISTKKNREKVYNSYDKDKLCINKR